MEHILRGSLGIVVLLAIAALLSRNRQAIRWKTVVYGVFLNLLLAFLILNTLPGQRFFELAGQAIVKIVHFSEEGTRFVFGPLYSGFTQIPHFSGWPYAFVLQALLPIVFFAALINVFYYLGIMQKIVALLTIFFSRLLGISSVESLVTAANVFLGQSQSPLVVAPYLKQLNDSQLFLTMVGGMATVGSGMVVVYAGMGAQIEYVLAASIMAAPAAIIFAKMMEPDDGFDICGGEAIEPMPRQGFGANVIDAVGLGAMEGWKAVVGVTVMLLAFISLIHLLDWVIVFISHQTLGLKTLLGWLFTPAAYIIGVPHGDVQQVAQLVGTKTAFNEVVAYSGLKDASLSPKGFMLACFALTGFANFSSIAIQIGCIGELAPSCRGRIAKLGVRAVIAATLANLFSAAIAGMFF
ncbi:nucleoside transporter C-terminal domain-containing protein [uncultured Desulfuromonas sp.]|uniref:NupC/NupG family nucleoside CNT transporter n=1 Tax=uncultured Desulfuromonas sp. TaxID=181013 RepID=UPI002AAB16BB|nr:nucleoside transporter C-terminal domain-containing protein [uncultured Desulfuromonas sp.]